MYALTSSLSALYHHNDEEAYSDLT